MSLRNRKPYHNICGKVDLSILYYILQYFWTNFNSFLKKYCEIHKKFIKYLLKLTSV